MSTKVYILLFVEGDFESIEQRPNSSEAHAYAEGVSDGANLYGAGSCTAYVMPEEKSAMCEDETPAQVERAMLHLAEKMELARLEATGAEP